MLHAAGLLEEPLDSTGLMGFGEPGAGSWITTYAHAEHAYVVIAGLRFDTAGRGEEGPRWRPEPRSPRRYTVRHPRESDPPRGAGTQSPVVPGLVSPSLPSGADHAARHSPGAADGAVRTAVK